MTIRKTNWYLFIAAVCFGVAQVGITQTTSVVVDGVVEPPELLGPAAKIPTISESDRVYANAFVNLLKDMKMNESDLPALDIFIHEYPANDVAYFWRANIEACVSKPPNLVQAKHDLETYQAQKHSDIYPSQETESLSLLAKMEVAKGHSSVALDLMEKAVTLDLGDSKNIFNTGGVKPETTSEFCTWNLTDLNLLASVAPHDWRPQVLLGLYYQFFAKFEESYYPQAAAAYRKAAALNGRTPLIPYLQGELYNQATFLVHKSWASSAARSEETSLAMFTKAVQLDPGFEPAYQGRAEAYLEKKQDAMAIRDFDKALALQPENDAIHADRGIAKAGIGRYYEAISDFGDALREKSDEDNYRPQLYQNRADGYVKVQDWRRAIDDYTSAIHLHLKSQIAVLSLAQFRGLYPEYAGVSDAVLMDKLNRFFMPQFAPDVFRKMLQDNGKWGVSSLNDLYESRGDAYLRLGDYGKAIRDFQRIFVGIPNFANVTERWRSLGTFGHGEIFYIDVKSSEVPLGRTPRIWVKRVGPKQSTVMAFALDCSGRKLQVTSSVVYDLNNNTVGGSEVAEGWSDVAPDTLGEQLWTGVCQVKP